MVRLCPGRTQIGIAAVAALLVGTIVTIGVRERFGEIGVGIFERDTGGFVGFEQQ